MSSLALLPGSGSPKLIGIARLAAQGEAIREGHNIEYFRLASRSLLNRVASKRSLPFVWAINPYRGCEFACKYCYARYTHEFMEMTDLAQRIHLCRARATVRRALETEERLCA